MTGKRPLIVWGEPPPRNRSRVRKSKYDPLITALAERPGEWARVQRSPDRRAIAGLNNALRSLAKRRGIKLEVRQRTNDAGDVDLWARIAERS